MSDWLFDLGNSRLKCAPLRDDGAPGEAQALGHDEGRFAAALDAVLPAHGNCAHVASVASPGLTVAVLEALTAAAFGQRRKMLRGSLKSLGGAEALLSGCGIEPTRRAETLDIAEFEALAQALLARGTG